MFGKGGPSSVALNVEDLIEQREAWKHTGWATLLLAYGSLGVIYGDIGTSPMYAMAGIFSTFDPNEQDILGAISLIFWSITLIVLLKYVLIVLRANDHGEGGTFAMYTRLCRIIGIGTGTTSSMNKSEHAEVLETAAVAGKIREATKLTRATRMIVKMLARYPKLNKHLNRAQATFEAEAAAAAAAAAAGAARAHQRKTGLIHRWAFPAATIKQYFQGSAGARATLLTVSVLATSMVVGDGVLTPAISVVSAVKGLTLKTEISQDGIIGISVTILVGLFMLQSLGTHRVAFIFSPVVIVWMLSILIIGIYNLAINGGAVLQGLSPHHIVLFFRDHGTNAWESLGGVMLCLTGAEALFADLGHFSMGAVAVGFSSFVYPCIIFAYLGQGAHLMKHPEDVADAFWSTVPDAFFWPMLVIATCTAVVASQALISGAFSIIRQAMTLGVFPPVQVVHTGEEVEGQIFIGAINTALMLLSIAVVAGFGGDGAKIGNAYGIAVATVMLITTCLLVLVMLVDWEISAVLVVPFALLFVVIEGGLLSANLIKVPQGGWFTIAVSLGVALIMFIWMSGQQAKAKALTDAKHSTTTTIANLLQGPEDEAPDAATVPDDADVPVQASEARPQYTPPSLYVNAAPPGVRGMRAGATSMSGAAESSEPGGARRSSLQPRRVRRLGSDLGAAAAAATAAAPTGSAASRARALFAGSGSGSGSLMPAPVPPRAARHRSSADGSSSARTRSDDGCPPLYPAPKPPTSRGLPKVTEEPEPSPKLRKSNSVHMTSMYPPPEPADDARDPLVRVAMYSDDGGGGGGGGGVRKSPHVLAHGFATASTAPENPGFMATPAVLELMHAVEGLGHVGLAKLRGMGIYYANGAHGMPPVMWHFLRNVEAVHEVVVLLQNIILPIPHLASLPGMDTSHRFGSCTLVAGVPHMYRVVARYGYMDNVDNGVEFAEQVKDFIQRFVQSQATGCEASGQGASVPSQQQAEAVELLQTAHEQGVVYYMGRTRLRMRKLNNSALQILHNFWFGDLYRFLAINAWDKVETWSIPPNSMVEIAMVLEI